MFVFRHKALFFSVFFLITSIYLSLKNTSSTLALEQPDNLPGTLEISGNGDIYNFTYSEGNLYIEGAIYKPSGSGPFPATVVSHGAGGYGRGFCDISKEILPDYLAICPDFEHAPQGPDPGGSEPNAQMAIKALDILESQQLSDLLGVSVDSNRLHMWGNSMGGFLTIKVAAKVDSHPLEC